MTLNHAQKEFGFILILLIIERESLLYTRARRAIQGDQIVQETSSHMGRRMIGGSGYEWNAKP